MWLRCDNIDIGNFARFTRQSPIEFFSVWSYLMVDITSGWFEDKKSQRMIGTKFLFVRTFFYAFLQASKPPKRRRGKKSKSTSTLAFVRLTMNNIISSFENCYFEYAPRTLSSSSLAFFFLRRSLFHCVHKLLSLKSSHRLSEFEQKNVHTYNMKTSVWNSLWFRNLRLHLPTPSTSQRRVHVRSHRHTVCVRQFHHAHTICTIHIEQQRRRRQWQAG